VGTGERARLRLIDGETDVTVPVSAIHMLGAHSDFVGFWWQVKDSRRVDIHSELQEHSLGYQTRSLGDVRRIHRKPSGEVF
jgi:hypothetical protein